MKLGGKGSIMLFSGRSLFSFLFLYPFILLILNFIQPTSNILLSLFYPHNLHHFPSNLEITSFFSMSVFFFFWFSYTHRSMLHSAIMKEASSFSSWEQIQAHKQILLKEMETLEHTGLNTMSPLSSKP